MPQRKGAADEHATHVFDGSDQPAKYARFMVAWSMYRPAEARMTFWALPPDVPCEAEAWLPALQVGRGTGAVVFVGDAVKAQPGLDGEVRSRPPGVLDVTPPQVGTGFVSSAALLLLHAVGYGLVSYLNVVKDVAAHLGDAADPARGAGVAAVGAWLQMPDTSIPAFSSCEPPVPERNQVRSVAAWRRSCRLCSSAGRLPNKYGCQCCSGRWFRDRHSWAPSRRSVGCNRCAASRAWTRLTCRRFRPTSSEAHCLRSTWLRAWSSGRNRCCRSGCPGRRPRRPHATLGRSAR